jgi:hypothetical protein
MMKIKAQRIAWALIILGLVTLFGMKLYAQHRRIEIFVSRTAPMPKELAAGLHMQEHGISSSVTIESPYAQAEDQIISMEEIGKIRSSLVWSTRTPILVDALVIHSTNHVSTRRTTARHLEECEIMKEGNEWVVKSATRTDLPNTPTVK